MKTEHETSKIKVIYIVTKQKVEKKYINRKNTMDDEESSIIGVYDSEEQAKKLIEISKSEDDYNAYNNDEIFVYDIVMHAMNMPPVKDVFPISFDNSEE